jgi:hypothetical protein
MARRQTTKLMQEAAGRVRMKRALTEYGYELTGNESTAMLEEMVLVTFSPSGDQFNGLVDRAKETIE